MNTEIRTYKTDIDLRRAWKQLRNKGRFVRLHNRDPLSLVVGPIIDGNWEHRTYERSDLAARAISGFQRYGSKIAIRCTDHRNCVMILDTDKVDEVRNTPDSLSSRIYRVGDKVRIFRGIFKNARGTVEARTPKGTVWVLMDLRSKSFSVEVLASFVTPCN